MTEMYIVTFELKTSLHVLGEHNGTKTELYRTSPRILYALVGSAISIRDPYICVVHESVPTNRTLSSTGPLSVQ